ncbi:SDR family NAD(P)-dependent oxidoreductase [candidate division KSB1 bacterium]
MTIKDKVILVTGSAKRVGKCIALTLAKKGANVIVNYSTSEEDAKLVTEEIKKLGVNSTAIKADISKADEVKSMIEKIIKEFGSIHVLVNNAAVFFKTPFKTLSEKDWDINIDINLKGTFLCSKYAADVMLKQKEGKIINTGDWSGIRPYTDYIPYCVSKAGVIALTKALAKTLAPDIQVNCILPGPIIFPDDFSEDEKKQIISAIPLKKIGSPEDIAATVLFLIEGSDFITGGMYAVDGGRLIS